MGFFQKIIVKVGTNVITQDNGQLDQHVIQNLVRQISLLKKQGIQVILVTSGAMGAGRSKIQLSEKLPRLAKRQILAAVGQAQLMKVYTDFFAVHKEFCAQILATKEDFRDKVHYFNMKNCFEALLKENIIPVVNENDVVSVEELMFTDNDELAGLIGAMMDVEAVIILSNIDGLFTKHPKYPDAELLTEVDFQKVHVETFITSEKSLFGRGGMLTKCRIAKKLSTLGITTFIANGKKTNILLGLLEKKCGGTQFLPSKKVSSIKRRIAYTHGYEKGIVVISQQAEEILKAKTISSLLPIGITTIEGNFEKGDIVKIKNQQEQDIGMGIVQYNASKAKAIMGLKDQKPLIHYDYLFLEP